MRGCFVVAACVLALSLGCISADPIDRKNPVRSAAEDEIKHLPGLSAQIKFKHYSGYLEADQEKPTNRFWHYWFVESQSDPANDPLVLWLNGGPGCSSLLGLMTELGPFRVSANGSITMNAYAWNKRANVVFMESPAGVGFTYAANGDVTANDDTTAEQNHLALKSFLRKFPQYNKSPLYLTGESYAGVYLPTLAARVDKDPALNLAGVAIGNGYLDANKLAESLVYFSYYHGLIGKSTWNGLSQYCCGGRAPARGQCKFTDSDRGEQCSDFVNRATEAILASGVNPYNLYDKCYGPDDTVHSTSNSLLPEHQLGRAIRSNGAIPEPVRRDTVVKSLILQAFNQTRSRRTGYSQFIKHHTKFALNKKLEDDPPCTDDSIVIDYLNRPEVKEALHIPDGLAPFSTCANIDYTMNYPARPGGLAPQMRQLIDSPRKPTLLVYNGDVDLMCNFFGDEWFVDDLNREVVKDYVPWHTNRQVSGFAKYFDRITYMTVKGSGHMVPTDRPAEALHMFEMFLDGMKPIEETE